MQCTERARCMLKKALSAFALHKQGTFFSPQSCGCA